MGQLVSPGNQSYHELGVAILEGAPRVPVALLLAVYYPALHSILDLEEGKQVSGEPWPHTAPPQEASLEHSNASSARRRKETR